MKINLKEIEVRDLYKGFIDNAEEGVFGYDGRLNIRPKYQREFIYKEDQRNQVINTIMKQFPLNVMYWADNMDGTYELLDGQQRTISICSYIKGDYSINYKYFHNLSSSEAKQILDYKLMIYVCEGTDKEKLDWFEIINIAGERLTKQELRNAVYSGTWVTDAKRYFSKTDCPGFNLGKKYISKVAIRQELLETVIKWISNNNIEDYMSKHQHDVNAKELWLYFNNVIEWVKSLFDEKFAENYKDVIKNQEWGFLYNEFHTNTYKSEELKDKVKKLVEDEEVENNKGIIDYIFTGKESKLNIRAFSNKQKERAFSLCKGECAKCKKVFESIDDMEADHITPWSKGGKTIDSNLQMLCKNCNRIKSNI